MVQQTCAYAQSETGCFILWMVNYFGGVESDSNAYTVGLQKEISSDWSHIP